MKQFFALAGLFALVSVSAQQQPQRKLVDPKAKQEIRVDHKMDRKDDQRKTKHRQRPSADQHLKQFDQYGLSSVQKQKLKDLHESKAREFSREREKQKKQFAKSRDQHQKDVQKRGADYDKKLEKILDKKQFAQYKQDREKHAVKKHAFRGDLKFKQEKRMRVQG